MHAKATHRNFTASDINVRQVCDVVKGSLKRLTSRRSQVIRKCKETSCGSMLIGEGGTGTRRQKAKKGLREITQNGIIPVSEKRPEKEGSSIYRKDWSD